MGRPQGSRALVEELRERADMIEAIDVNERPRNVTIMRDAADTIERLLNDESPAKPRAGERAGVCGACGGSGIDVLGEMDYPPCPKCRAHSRELWQRMQDDGPAKRAEGGEG